MNHKPLRAAACKAQALQQLLDSQPLIDHAPRHASLRVQRLPPWRSRWAALDAALPDAGWPASGLIELLQDAPVHAEWHLLGRALGERLRNGSGPLVLIGDDGLQPFAPALAACGIAPQRLLWVRCAPVLQRLWACEQALRCPEVSLVLAWLPQATSLALRRLQLLAQQSGRPLLVVRPARAALQDSPARLRVLVRQRQARLQLRVLKCPGAPGASAAFDHWIDLGAPLGWMPAPHGTALAQLQPQPQPEPADVAWHRPADPSDALDRLAAA
jgi:hypothetical protein